MDFLQVLDTKIDRDLFDEFTCLVKYVGEKVVKWNDFNLSTDQRWLEI